MSINLKWATWLVPINHNTWVQVTYWNMLDIRPPNCNKKIMRLLCENKFPWTEAWYVKLMQYSSHTLYIYHTYTMTHILLPIMNGAHSNEGTILYDINNWNVTSRHYSQPIIHCYGNILSTKSASQNWLPFTKAPIFEYVS